MIEQYNIISSTAAGGVPTSTAKIETPEEFAQTIKDNAFDPRCWIPSEEVPTGYFDIKEAAQIIAARDTAIRAESAALLKMCEEALVLGREKVQKWVNEIYDADGVEYIGLGSTLDKIDATLAALREAGVI